MRFFRICIFFAAIGLLITNTVHAQSDFAITRWGAGGTVHGVVQTHYPDNEIPWYWFSYVPESADPLNENFILVPIYGGLFDYTENTEQVRTYTELIAQRADDNNLIILSPSIPRGRNPDYYAVAFDRLCFSDDVDPFYQRPDLVVNKMIDRLSQDLRMQGYRVHDKVFVEGFSCGGMFAQRYCLLQPERVQAIAAGQCGGSLTLPIRKYDNMDLTWAVGISDFQSLVGKDFNDVVYRQIPQFIYIGDKDTEHSHFEHPNPDGFWSEEMVDFINSIFGDTDPERITNMCNLMKKLGYNVACTLYPGVGHEVSPWNTPSIYNDIYNFFREQRIIHQTNEGKVPISPHLTMQTSGLDVFLSWDQVSDALGYIVLYAPYPDASYIGSFDLGNKTSLSATLWSSAAFYVAVQAYNQAGNSDISNIETFSMNPEDIDDDADGHTENQGDCTDNDSATYPGTID